MLVILDADLSGERFPTRETAPCQGLPRSRIVTGVYLHTPMKLYGRAAIFDHTPLKSDQLATVPSWVVRVQVKPGSEFFFAVFCENYSDPGFTDSEWSQ